MIFIFEGTTLLMILHCIHLSTPYTEEYKRYHSLVSDQRVRVFWVSGSSLTINIMDDIQRGRPRIPFCPQLCQRRWECLQLISSPFSPVMEHHKDEDVNTNCKKKHPAKRSDQVASKGNNTWLYNKQTLNI